MYEVNINSASCIRFAIRSFGFCFRRALTADDEQRFTPELHFKDSFPKENKLPMSAQLINYVFHSENKSSVN